MRFYDDNAAMVALEVAVTDNMVQEWNDAIISWASSQKSRRIALRCANYEQDAIDILAAAAETVRADVGTVTGRFSGTTPNHIEVDKIR